MWQDICLGWVFVLWAIQNNTVWVVHSFSADQTDNTTNVFAIQRQPSHRYQISLTQLWQCEQKLHPHEAVDELTKAMYQINKDYFEIEVMQSFSSRVHVSSTRIKQIYILHVYKYSIYMLHWFIDHQKTFVNRLILSHIFRQILQPMLTPVIPKWRELIETWVLIMWFIQWPWEVKLTAI